MASDSFDMAEMEKRMKGAVASLKQEFGGLRTGRASASLLDPIVINAYGAKMPLTQVATVTAPEPRMNYGAGMGSQPSGGGGKSHSRVRPRAEPGR